MEGVKERLHPDNHLRSDITTSHGTAMQLRYSSSECQAGSIGLLRTGQSMAQLQIPKRAWYGPVPFFSSKGADKKPKEYPLMYVRKEQQPKR